MSAKETPVMQQHARAKRAYADALVFFRLGDFYELFGEDAIVAAKALDLTLTSRNKGKPDEIPMAGVPYHAAHGYIGRLLEQGYKIAICEQMADPAKTKGIVPREVVRVITPGLITEGDQLEARRNNFLAAVEVGKDGVGLALLEWSTGELRAARVEHLAAAFSELCRAAPAETLVGYESASDELSDLAPFRALGAGAVRADAELTASERELAWGNLGSDAQHLSALAANAAARALRFARACNPGSALTITAIKSWQPADHLLIDRVAQTHLELVDSLSGDKKVTLLATLDRSLTPQGARLLRRRLLAPLLNVAQIRRRLDAVELFVVHSKLRDLLREQLAQIGDLERLAVRSALGEATPRDLGALRDSLQAASQALDVLASLEDRFEREVLELSQLPDRVSDLCEELARALVDRPSALAKEGEIFRTGFDAELDELDGLRKNGAARMVELEGRLREQTSISTLKIRFTRVFGWYIEVSRGQMARVPEGFRRKQTVATGERYTTPELDELAERITHAEERHRERELFLLKRLVELAGHASPRVTLLADCVARWDVAAALAELAHQNDYCRPEVDDSDQIVLRESRHPVVERLSAEGRFVPNGVDLDVSAERLWLITGPNMAGKSTLLRQVALAIILAQMGSFVPARSARLGVVDRVLSRVGASDNVARGESTFMVEMRETAEILRSATRRSLVILDEIGRGTSTYDGLSIAWAVAEHLNEVISCRALFATHYHELTVLAEQSKHVANYSVSAREVEGDIVFLHRVTRGAASRSYGVAVAKLAGLPASVLARARAILKGLEGGEVISGVTKNRSKAANADQLDMFGPKAAQTKLEREILESVRALELEQTTPLDALQFLAKLKQRLGADKV